MEWERGIWFDLCLNLWVEGADAFCDDCIGVGGVAGEFVFVDFALGEWIYWVVDASESEVWHFGFLVREWFR